MTSRAWSRLISNTSSQFFTKQFQNIHWIRNWIENSNDITTHPVILLNVWTNIFQYRFLTDIYIFMIGNMMNTYDIDFIKMMNVRSLHSWDRICDLSKLDDFFVKNSLLDIWDESTIKWMTSGILRFAFHEGVSYLKRIRMIIYRLFFFSWFFFTEFHSMRLARSTNRDDEAYTCKITIQRLKSCRSDLDRNHSFERSQSTINEVKRKIEDTDENEYSILRLFSARKKSVELLQTTIRSKRQKSSHDGSSSKRLWYLFINIFTK